MKSKRIAIDRLLAVRRRLYFDDLTPMKDRDGMALDSSCDQRPPSKDLATDSGDISATVTALASAAVAATAPVTGSPAKQCDLKGVQASSTTLVDPSSDQQAANTIVDENNNDHTESDMVPNKPIATVRRLPSVNQSIKRTSDSMFKLFRRKILRSMWVMESKSSQWFSRNFNYYART